MTTRVIYIVGNDGSGKTTYSTNLREELLEQGKSAQRLHYYRLGVRSAFRSLIEVVSSPSKKKLEAPPAPRESHSTGAGQRVRASLLVAFLFLYQMAMAAEMRLRAAWIKSDHLIVDRSYIDDLVSILKTFRLDTPRALIRLSASIFPQSEVIYVSATPEVEFDRIVDVDLSRAVHLEKSHRYEEIVEILEEAGSPVRRVNTNGPPGSQTQHPIEEWE